MEAADYHTGSVFKRPQLETTPNYNPQASPPYLLFFKTYKNIFHIPALNFQHCEHMQEMPQKVSQQCYAEHTQFQNIIMRTPLTKPMNE